MKYEEPCTKFTFNYTYAKAKITIKRFELNLTGSINGDTLTLKDEKDKEYLFIRDYEKYK